jgi:hypothetical protein
MSDSQQAGEMLPSDIPALSPRAGGGHRFVCYGDCCSGVPGSRHADNFAAVNAVVECLRTGPDFVCFLGDEVAGLTTDAGILRRQWRHWLDREMAWLDRASTPLFHTTSNHTTYDLQSEAVFRDVLSHLPRNGPPGQEGLTYFVRRGDLLLVFVNTAWSGLGGEGRVETAWLDETLCRHADARHKLVLGHHPAYPVNGFSGAFQRELEPDNGRAFWEVLVRHRVTAYICSHMLAFDVQVHHGVLQVLTAGAGTVPLMPEGIEYLHCVQAALDSQGLRYQVLDTAGRVREWLEWPLVLPPSDGWVELAEGESGALVHESGAARDAKLVQSLTRAQPPATPPKQAQARQSRIVAMRFTGVTTAAQRGEPQTLFCAWDPGPHLEPLWVGLTGCEQRLKVLMMRAAGESPHHWHGPPIPPGRPFSVQLAIHTGMGPGGLLWRWDDAEPWSSMAAASPWGAEKLRWPSRWSIGQGAGGESDRPFRGRTLSVRCCIQRAHLDAR